MTPRQPKQPLRRIQSPFRAHRSGSAFGMARDSAHECGSKEWCCDRGSSFDVDQDKCKKSEGHNVHVKPVAELIKDFQAATRSYRIPFGVDDTGGLRGCTEKNAIQCKDEEQKHVCCCNAGFIYSFPERGCVPVADDPTDVEDPVPGSEKWGLTHSVGQASKCVNHPKKYCCHRACQYEVGKDRCGECVSYEQNKPPVAWDVIFKYVSEKGDYVIPPSIDSPGVFGCSTKHSKKCTVPLSAEKHCCCHQGRGSIAEFDSIRLVCTPDII
ncbi:ak1 [Symbiodinium natans]|uniref:Ak1 protein n=1 Tax=Symbiodinium natans TaxID=878477 RepID=A0A812U030_9DINO|nr:ak1 [Symbiodinium natans]